MRSGGVRVEGQEEQQGKLKWSFAPGVGTSWMWSRGTASKLTAWYIGPNEPSNEEAWVTKGVRGVKKVRGGEV